MGLLRIIWKDIRWLGSRFTLAVKIAGLIFVIALIVTAWHLGADWWSAPVVFKHEARPLWSVVLVVGGLGFMVYLAWVIERYRKSR